MTILQALILGIIQGLTELLPISSSGHLDVIPWLFNWTKNVQFNIDFEAFDVALHFGTFLAIALFFFKKVQIEKEKRDVNITMVKELKNWAKINGLKICIKTIERPISIKGHAYYQMDAKRHYVIISFSK